MASTLDITTGSKTVGTSRVQIVDSSHTTNKPFYGVQIIPASGNAGTVYVGNNTVTADGGDTTTGIPVPSTGLFLPARRPEDLYAIASAADQKIFYYIT